MTESPDYPDCKKALIKARSTDLYCVECRIRIAQAQGDAILVFNKEKQEYEAHCAYHCKIFGKIGISTGDLKYLSNNIIGRLITIEEAWNYAYALRIGYPKKNKKILKTIEKTSERFKIVLDRAACFNWSDYLQSANNHSINPNRHQVPLFPSFPGVKAKKLFVL